MKTKISIFFLILVLLISCNKLKTGVRVGEGMLTKTLLFSGSFPGRIMTIQVGNFERNPIKEIAILGMMKGVILDAKTHQVKKMLSFRQSVELRPEIVIVLSNGSLEIMRRGGGFGDVGLVNELGEFIWKYNKVGTSPEMDAGDLDGDRETEFYVADLDGLHRLDYQGREVWKTLGQEWEVNVAIYKPESNDTGLAITRGNDGKIRFWNSSGRLVREVTPESGSYGLEVVKWGDHYYLLSESGSSIILTDFDGRIFFEYALEEINEEAHFRIRGMAIRDIRGVSVKFKPDKKPYLAVLTDFRAATGKAMLSVFTLERQLVYQEIINSSRGIAALKNSDGSESLLIGDGGKNVWIYEMAK
jgi:WD40 repeat protein